MNILDQALRLLLTQFFNTNKRNIYIDLGQYNAKGVKSAAKYLLDMITKQDFGLNQK